MASKTVRNPRWSFDETLLALDLYLQTRPTLPAETDLRVVALSGALQKMAAAKGITGDDSFRNPNGVSMKIANLSRFDRAGPPGRTGLQNGSAVEEQAWERFAGDLAGLRAAANAIKADFAEVASLPENGATGETKTTTKPAALIGVADASTPRLWVSGMWGFDPAKHGYVGFTMPGSREAFMRKSLPGDLVLIVGQQSDHTAARDVGRILGLVELDNLPIEDAVRMSPAEYALKVQRFGAEKSRHALPIKRAWKIGREIKARDLVGQTYTHANARAIGVHSMLLTGNEAEAVLRLPARAVAVFGEAEWNAQIDPTAREEALNKGTRRGPRPSFGELEQTRTDGSTYLYVTRLEGPVAQMFPGRNLIGKGVVKVGMSNDVLRRTLELNAGFPPGSAFRWKQTLTQRFDSGDLAYDAESALLALLEARSFALGNEFAIVPDRDLASLFGQVCRSAAFVITS